ncbi:membrane protein insertase YidC, partial [Olleya sp. AH-315-F22]|nr:membrane protein insertase YidC [Olleya sp. AH-315-F22]
MEEKKLDINSIIGFILIAGILMYMLYQNQPTPEEIEAQEKAKQEQIDAEAIAQEKAADTFVATPTDFSAIPTNDSTQLANLKN